VQTRLLTSLAAIDPGSWNALVGEDDPFVEHAFLSLLEESGSVGRGTGWVPMHVAVYEGEALVAAIPAYVKDDSWGEFVFDFQWARAAQQLGVRYYPKLVAMVPFTPATGRRLLIKEGVDRAAATGALARGLIEAASAARASSVHVHYLTAEELDALVATGLFAARTSLQFHWQNEGYRDFEHYLDAFRSPARKQVRRERRVVRESGFEVRVKEGRELSASEWHTLDVIYRLNCARHGSYPYLNERFFAAMPERLAERVVAVLAYKDGEPIAGSLNFEKGAHLYGRYWGTTDDAEMLHFECCYYAPIERAIARGARRFEAGAQGHHKLKRGLMPSEIHSAVWVRDPRLSRAILDYLPRETAAVREEMAMLAAEGPFKRGGEPG
jgi:hypothetical protein